MRLSTRAGTKAIVRALTSANETNPSYTFVTLVQSYIIYIFIYYFICIPVPCCTIIFYPPTESEHTTTTTPIAASPLSANFLLQRRSQSPKPIIQKKARAQGDRPVGSTLLEAKAKGCLEDVQLKLVCFSP